MDGWMDGLVGGWMSHHGGLAAQVLQVGAHVSVCDGCQVLRNRRRCLLWVQRQCLCVQCNDGLSMRWPRHGQPDLHPEPPRTACVTSHITLPFSLVDACRTVLPLCVNLMFDTPYFLLYSVRTGVPSSGS